jgi:hypothetical protein
MSTSVSPEFTRALNDLHNAFFDAFTMIDKGYSGNIKAADQHIYLIREYSQAVARVVEAFKGNNVERICDEDDS